MLRWHEKGRDGREILIPGGGLRFSVSEEGKERCLYRLQESSRWRHSCCSQQGFSLEVGRREIESRCQDEVASRCNWRQSHSSQADKFHQPEDQNAATVVVTLRFDISVGQEEDGEDDCNHIPLREHHPTDTSD